MITLMILLDVNSTLNKLVIMKKILYFSLIFFITLFLSACTDQEKPINDPAEEVLKAMFNCPNNELFHSDALTIIGLNVENVIDRNEALNKKAIETEIWQKEFASYFTEKGFETFIANGTNVHYHTIAFISKYTTEVQKIEKTQESKNQINYTVFLKVKSIEQSEIKTTVFCSIIFDEDNKIQEIEITEDTELYGILFP